MPDILSKVSFSGNVAADLVFFLVAAFVATASVVMFFHWRKYGMGGAAMAAIEFVFLGVSAALLAAAFFSLK